jgi:hypothetical protein
MSALSETIFLIAGERSYFVKDERGAVTQLVLDAVEGKMVGARKPVGK